MARTRKKSKRRPSINLTRERSFHVAERRDLESSYPRHLNERRVPAIRLSGRWLQMLGFTTGTKVTVTPERRRLVLTVAE